MTELLQGDVVVLQMDDELIIVAFVDADSGTFLHHVPSDTIEGLTIDFYHEYEISDIMTIYREVK